MQFPADTQGKWADEEKVKQGDGDIIGPAGQTERKATPVGTEQIAAWGGFKGGAEECVEQTEDKKIKLWDGAITPENG